MNLAQDVADWLTASGHWTGAGSIPTRLVEHLFVTGLVLVIGFAIALPLGVLVGHSGRGVATLVTLSGAARALPTLGLVTLVALWLGIGLEAPVVALVVLAIPPLLAGIYSGMLAVDRDVVDTARAIGMTEVAIVREVELPLALPSVVAGLRSAALQVVSTVTVAAYVADEGLGRYLFEGLRTRQYGEMLGGAVLVMALALLIDRAFAQVERNVAPATRLRGSTAGDHLGTRTGVVT